MKKLIWLVIVAAVSGCAYPNCRFPAVTASECAAQAVQDQTEQKATMAWGNLQQQEASAVQAAPISEAQQVCESEGMRRLEFENIPALLYLPDPGPQISNIRTTTGWYPPAGNGISCSVIVSFSGWTAFNGSGVAPTTGGIFSVRFFQGQPPQVFWGTLPPAF